MINLKLPAVKTLVVDGIIILTLAVLLFGFFRSCHPDPVVSRATTDSTVYWRNQTGQLVASQKATAEQFDAQNAEIKHLLDSIAHIYKTKPSAIREVVIATVAGNSKLEPVPGTLQHDTVFALAPQQKIGNLRQTFQSRWYTAHVQIGDNSYLTLQSRDTITAMWKIVKEGRIFNRKKYLQFNITLADTTRRITGIRTYRFEDHPKEFAVTLESSLLYVRQRVEPVVALGFQRTTGRLTGALIAGQNLSNVPLWKEPPAWYGGIRVSYQLIKF